MKVYPHMFFGAVLDLCVSPVSHPWTNRIPEVGARHDVQSFCIKIVSTSR